LQEAFGAIGEFFQIHGLSLSRRHGFGRAPYQAARRTVLLSMWGFRCGGSRVDGGQMPGGVQTVVQDAQDQDLSARSELEIEVVPAFLPAARWLKAHNTLT
jgi:hypothetical protein